MKYFSTFSGIGGFELGIKRAIPNAECVGFSEIDKYAVQVYLKNFPNHKNYGDITKIKPEELPDFDLLVGGFPCQPFSYSGLRKGFEDTRGTMFFELARIVKEKQPRYLLLENVKGLVSNNKGEALKTILLTLQSLGYYIDIDVHNSKDFGVPQNRERIFFQCRHVKTLIGDGQSLSLSILKKIITEYLYQILLNNLEEVQKLQELKSKDWVIGCLLLKEISQNTKRKYAGRNMKDGILTATEENKSVLEEVSLWQNIEKLLLTQLGENFSGLNKSTILTVIKQIIELKIYTFSEMQRVILLGIVLLRSSSNHSWKEVLLDLTIMMEHTKKYSRFNILPKNEQNNILEEQEVAISESSNAYITKNIQNNERVFIIGHIRGEPRPEVFSIKCYDSIYNGECYRKINQSSGNRQPFIAAMRGRNPDNPSDRTNGAPTKQRLEVNKKGTSNTLTSVGKDNLVLEGLTVRRLTPLECERLQGFPDGWTTGISESQRYKCIGNAVTVNVVEHIFKNLVGS